MRRSEVLAIVLLSFAGWTCGVAQQAAPEEYVPGMKFEVASVRQSAEADSYWVGANFAPHTTTLRIENFDMENLLAMAYGARRDAIVGLPEWRVKFSVEAKGDSAADERLAKLSGAQQRMEQQHMLQGLLAERFALKAHWEMRAGPTLRLIEAKGGARLLSGGTVSEAETKEFGARPVPPIYQRGGGAAAIYELVGHGCTMAGLVEALALQFQLPVTDGTGLPGKYDFVLRYKGARTSDRSVDDLEPTPALEVALGQLGLRLEKARGEQRVLVVDHVEKPSAN